MKICRSMLVVVPALLAVACGSAHTDEELARAAGQGVSLSAGGAGGSAGADGVPGTEAQSPTADGGSTAGDASAPTGAPGEAGAQGGTATGGCAGKSTKPIKVGSVSTMSGVVGSALAGWENALRAWAASMNANGGINCHKVEMTLVDDGADPARNRALVQEVVEQKGVIALVHSVSPLSGQASVSYIQQKRVPVIGVEGGERWANENSMYFPSFANDTVLSYSFAAGTARQFVPEGKTQLATIFCAEIAACESTTNAAAFEAEGMKIVYSAKVSLAQPDYTAQCLGARNAGAQVVYLAVETQSTIRLANNCAGIGYHPVYAATAQVTSDDQLKSPNLDGMAVVSPTLPWFASGTPAFEEFSKAMKRFSPGAPFNGAAIQGWTSAKLLEAALKDIDDPTSANVLKGLYDVQNNDLGGLTYPVTFRAGQADAMASQKSCWWFTRIKSGKWTNPDGFKRHCR